MQAQMKPRFETNILKLVDEFHSEEKCRAFLERLRWPDGITCPRCQSKKCYSDSDQWECESCDYTFSVTSGTVMHDTHLPLRKWFIAVYLMIEGKKGISALQLKRTLNVSYQTAWCLSHRVRAAMRDSYPVPLKGIVEVDETWVGGEVKGKGKGYVGNKAVVVGAVQREGKIVLQVVAGRDKASLEGFIRKHIAADAEAIYTDELPTYRAMNLADEDTRHEVVNHKAEEYVRGGVHTNSVENVWSLFKRSIIGSYHKVSIKHLDAYLDELEWRFNNRDNPWLFRDTLLRLLEAEPLPLNDLVT